MKLSEDGKIETSNLNIFAGDYDGPEPYSPDDFKLESVEEQQPLKLQLHFVDPLKKRKRAILIWPKENAIRGDFRVYQYKDGLEKLKGKSWAEIVKWDFKFDQASHPDT